MICGTGFRVTNAGCCGIGRNSGQITCLPLQTPCPNRNEYVFWDAFHPGEAANVIIGRRSYRAESSSDAYPFDIERLAQIWLTKHNLIWSTKLNNIFVRRRGIYHLCWISKFLRSIRSSSPDASTKKVFAVYHFCALFFSIVVWLL